jgi:hypothetical protein
MNDQSGTEKGLSDRGLRILLFIGLFFGASALALLFTDKGKHEGALLVVAAAASVVAYVLERNRAKKLRK